MAVTTSWHTTLTILFIRAQDARALSEWIRLQMIF